ncbi:MAG: hypothetical protein NTY90_05405 [Candidatus Micrarchaeota archaeon]|nr:hypothetical protein [Candidatus Micrarchaeota archaeon]
MRPWQYLIGIALLVALAWLLFFGGSQQVSTQISLLAGPVSPGLASFGEQFGKDFIYYNDSNYSFAIKYPIGYEAERLPDPQVLVRFKAFNPYGISEVIDVAVSETLYSSADFENDLASFPVTREDYRADVIEKQVVNVNGREAFFATINQSLGGEPVMTKTAVINCGTYSAYVTATIPQSASADRIVADYMIRSFRC